MLGVICISLILGLLPSVGLAFSCDDYDNSSRLGPLRNNGASSSSHDKTGLNWCGFYSAADLMTDALGVRVSAIDIGIQYLGAADYIKKNQVASDGPVLIPSIEAEEALLYSRFHGFCPESELKSDNFGLIGEHDNAFEVLQLISRIDNEVADTPVCTIESEAAKSAMPNVSISEIATAFTNGATVQAWKKIADENCKNKRFRAPKGVFASPIQKYNIPEEVDKRISQGKPVELGFDLSYLSVRDGNPWEPGVGHSAVIDRRRKNPDTGKCEYRLRLNWGAKCRKIVGCQDGYLWINRELMTESSIIGGYIRTPND